MSVKSDCKSNCLFTQSKAISTAVPNQIRSRRADHARHASKAATP